MEKKIVSVWFEDDGYIWKLYVAYEDQPKDKRLYLTDFHDRSRPKFDLYIIIGMTEKELYHYALEKWTSKEVHV